jgi:hypothetical protein
MEANKLSFNWAQVTGETYRQSLIAEHACSCQHGKCAAQMRAPQSKTYS